MSKLKSLPPIIGEPISMTKVNVGRRTMLNAERAAKLGTPIHAIRYAVDEIDDAHEAIVFLSGWMDGSIIDDPEWDDYRAWLAKDAVAAKKFSYVPSNVLAKRSKQNGK
jgi:hypothetical protein